MNRKLEKVDKRYSLYNSYFKNRKDNYPDTILEIVQYENRHNELPFIYLGDNWVYDAMIERQKRKGVDNSQYMTPDSVVDQIGVLTDSFNPENMKVLNACCGIGQITGCLLQRGFNVDGYDGDGDLVEVCKILYPNAAFFQMDFREVESDRRWDLIVSNPPHELKLLSGFMEWLSSALSAEGKAILILPKDFMKKDKPSGLVKILHRFNICHEEEITETIPFTNTKNIICIVGLSEEHKALCNIENATGIENPSQEDSTNIREQLKKIEIMKADDKTLLVPLSHIRPNPDNDRKNIKEEDIQELALSIKKSGLLQPITLRPKEKYFEIVCGERRYRAFIKNGDTEIPAYIKDLSDFEVMEMALAENLLRKDLTPIEESNAFQKFINTGKYTVEDLVNTFGKTEAYIRSRLRLQHLTDDFKALLDNGIIVLGIGLEISKYNLKTQVNIFKEHFVNDDNTNWKELGVKELAGRIERAYTTDLSKYKFDKKECASCQFNTGTHSLFSNPENGKCTDAVCLNRKRTEFTMSFCKVVSEQYDNIEVCITPYDKLDESMNKKLEEQGIKVVTTIANDFPEEPRKPEREKYNTEEEYKAALEEHTIDILDYNSEMDNIQEKVDKGEIKKVVYIGDNNPKLGYIPVTVDPDKDPVKVLEAEDEANKKQAMAGVIKELGQLLQTYVLPISAFSAFEEQVMLFVMLDSLSVKYYPLFGIKDVNIKSLTDDMKYKISKSLTAEQKAIIQRDFIIKHLAKSVDSNSKSLLLIEFSRQHFLQETTDISKKYTDSYNVKYQKIKKQKEKLMDKKEKIKVPEISN